MHERCRSDGCTSKASPSGRRTLPGWDAAARRACAARARRPTRRPGARRRSCWRPAERRRAPDTVALALEVAGARVAARRPRRGRPAQRVRLRARRPGHQRLHVQHAGERPDAAVADQVPQLGAQRGVGLLDHRHRLHAGQQRRWRPTSAALPPACSKPRRSARPTAAGAAGRLRHCRAVGALASVTTQPRPAGGGAGAGARAHRAHRRGLRLDRCVQRGRAPRPLRMPRPARRSPATRWPTRCRCSRRWHAARRAR